MIIDGYERRIVRLEREVAEVREQLRRNSQNSSKPPSSDGPHVKRKPPKEPSGRKSSYGTQRHQGSRFVEAILTVVTSCQQQERDLLGYLTACCRAFYRRRVVPSFCLSLFFRLSLNSMSKEESAAQSPQGRIERKLAAILSVEVKGYSRLMG